MMLLGGFTVAAAQSSHGYKNRAAFVVEQSQPQSRSAAGAGHESERRTGQGCAATDRGF